MREFRATAAALGIGPAARAQLLGDVAGARRDEAATQLRELQERYGRRSEGPSSLT